MLRRMTSTASSRPYTSAIWTLGAARRHPLTAVRLRDETVQRRSQARVALGSIDAQVPGRLVELVLDHVAGHDLDVRIDDARRIARGHAVPRVRLEQSREQVLDAHRGIPSNSRLRAARPPETMGAPSARSSASKSSSAS